MAHIWLSKQTVTTRCFLQLSMRGLCQYLGSCQYSPCGSCTGESPYPGGGPLVGADAVALTGERRAEGESPSAHHAIFVQGVKFAFLGAAISMLAMDEPNSSDWCSRGHIGIALQ
jgi:hypothetical protein